MGHHLKQLSLVAAALFLFGGSAAAQHSSNARYTQFKDTENADISNPGTNNVRLFFDDDGFYWKNSAGTVTPVGSSISGLTAGVIPQAGSATSLVNSKMTASGTNGGTWTLYDDTGGTGVTQVFIRSGASQSTNNQLLIGSTSTGLFESAAGILKVTNGSTGFGSVTAAAFGANTGSSAATSFYFNGDPNTGVYSDGADRLFLSAGGNTVFLSTSILRVPTTQIAAVDTTFERAAVGILKLSDGAGALSGFGVADSATNTVSDALILRHATSGTAAASFGTGLVWEGENASGVMHPMASIDAQWGTATDTNEHSSLVFKNYHSGAESTMLTMLSQYGETYMMAPGPMRLRGSDIQLDSTGGVGMYFALTYDVKWVLASPGHWAPFTTNTYDIGTSSALVKNIYAAGLAVSDAATNTVTDAIALRHATSGTAAASFGTGLLFQGEDAGGNMQDMASIDAVYIAATDTAEEVDLKFYTMKAGAEDLAMTIGADFFGTGAKSLEFPGDLYVYAAGGNLFLGGGGVEWEVAGTALRPVTTNYNTIGTSSLLIKDVYVSTSIQGTRTQAISDNAAAATFVTIAVPTSDTTVGGRIFYTITAIDAGTAIQTKTGTYSFGLNNIGGTVTGAGTDVLEHSQLSAGTLAPTFSVNISGTNAQFQLVLDTSLDAAAETLKIEYRVQIDSGTATVTPAT